MRVKLGVGEVGMRGMCVRGGDGDGRLGLCGLEVSGRVCCVSGGS